MRVLAHAGAVRTEPFDIDMLITEIVRYLAAVDAFRAAGYAPRWARVDSVG